VKVKLLKNHTHKGCRYATGFILEVDEKYVERFAKRGIAEPVQLAAPVEPEPTPSFLYEPLIGDTDGPATNE
jgi:hypothetical protein